MSSFASSASLFVSLRGFCILPSRVMMSAVPNSACQTGAPPSVLAPLGSTHDTAPPIPSHGTKPSRHHLLKVSGTPTPCRSFPRGAYTLPVPCPLATPAVAAVARCRCGCQRMATARHAASSLAHARVGAVLKRAPCRGAVCRLGGPAAQRAGTPPGQARAPRARPRPVCACARLAQWHPHRAAPISPVMIES